MKTLKNMKLYIIGFVALVVMFAVICKTNDKHVTFIERYDTFECPDYGDNGETYIRQAVYYKQIGKDFYRDKDWELLGARHVLVNENREIVDVENAINWHDYWNNKF